MLTGLVFNEIRVSGAFHERKSMWRRFILREYPSSHLSIVLLEVTIVTKMQFHDWFIDLPILLMIGLSMCNLTVVIPFLIQCDWNVRSLKISSENVLQQEVEVMDIKSVHFGTMDISDAELAKEFENDGSVEISVD
jgi:hypothetical protein